MDEDPDVPEVRPPTIDDIRRICRALDEAEAHYVLIGGFAVILHGGLRTTKDIDLLVDPEPANVERLKRALSVLDGLDVSLRFAEERLRWQLDASGPQAAPPEHAAACRGRLVDALRAAGKPVE